ncbi:MAG: endonuclease/exonuclease/phosphatase family protein [Clostridia bacterium]|nr:endonuclease/exonuclease/phosphatase family protein [Clostridia bacterium]
MKKSTFIRILSILLAIMMLMSTFIACNKDNPLNDESNGTESDAPTTYPKTANLSSYKIVFSEGASDYVKTKVATVINNAMEKKFGVKLEAVSDSTVAAPYEIVLGETNRFDDVSKAHFDSLRGAYSLDGKNTLTYGTGIVYNDNRVFLLAKSDDALFSIANYFCSTLESQVNAETKDFTPNETPYFSKSAKTEDSPYLAEGADLRVMSFNILMSQYAAIESNKRDLRMANILMYYMPDVVALQETEELWHTLIEKYLVEPGIYAKAAEKTASGAYNMTTFLYNPKTVKLLNTEIHEVVKNSDVRLFVVCEFEKLSDGTRFVTTNFHPASDGYVQEHATHFKRLFVLKDQALAKYKDLPIIMMGDFNTPEEHEMYPKFITNMGVKDAKYEAETLVRRYATYLKGGPFGTLEKGDMHCYDHIFVNANTKVKLFNVVIDHGVTLTSDHLPIYADISTK